MEQRRDLDSGGKPEFEGANSVGGRVLHQTLYCMPTVRSALTLIAGTIGAAALTRSQEGGQACQAEMLKSVKEILAKPRPHWVGNGFHVFPVFHDKAFTNDVSPFLMFDYAAPKEFPPTTQRRGVGTHPHKGMETVTIAFQGEVEHHDSTVSVWVFACLFS